MSNDSKPLADMGRFATVVVDPPWPLSPTGYRSENHGRVGVGYRTMRLQDIKRLPLGSVVEQDAFLFCWATNRFLPAALNALEGWGAKYSFLMAWQKPQGIGLPNTPMFNCEWVAVGRYGNPKFKDTRSFMVGNCWPRAAASAKPDEFYDLLRRVTPEPRLDVFSRREIPGFTCWGDDVGTETLFDLDAK